MLSRNVRSRSLAAVALGAIAMLVVSACGGGEATSTPKPPATTTSAPGATATPVRTAPAATPTPAPTATPTGAQPKYGGVLKVRLLREWPNFDTYDSVGGANSTSHMMNLQSNLIAFDVSSTKVLPDLAERWTIAADGASVTFVIRKGVKWHDGKDLTASDIVWNLQRGMNGTPPTTWNVGRFVNVASIEAPDAATVRVNMKQPSASFVPNMASVWILMYAPHSKFAPNTADYKANVIGTGPFKLKSWNVDQSLEVVKNESYYKKDDAGRQLPYLDGISFPIINDPTAALAALRSGRTDCGCIYDSEYMTPAAETLQREVPGIKLQLAQVTAYSMFYNQKAPWTNPLVRKAVQVGLDRVTLKALWRNGTPFYPPTIYKSPGVGGQWGLPVAEMLQVPGWRVKDGKKDPADIAEMNRLFKEAGVDPKTITAVISSGTFQRDFAEAFQPILAATGINAQLKIEPNTVPTLQAGSYDVSFFFSNESFDDPSDTIPNYILSNGPQNWGKWPRPKVDEIYQQQERALDPAKRKELVWQLQRELLNDAGYSPVIGYPNIQGTLRNVFGWQHGLFNTGSYQRLERVWVDRT